MIAEAHELAFGLDYGCTFEVENKSGKPLHIRIQGIPDGNVRLSCDVDTQVEGIKTFETRFTVDEITEPQDIWRVHPCAMAEVRVNGQAVVFGLGIETKWPVSLNIEELKKVAVPGAEFTSYFNFTSALLTDAAVTVRLPEEPAAVNQYTLPTYKAEIPAMGRISIKAQTTAIAYGHESMKISYEIFLKDGRTISYTRPIPVSSRGLTGVCGFETETDYILQSGLWWMGLNKNGAFTWTNHVYDIPCQPGFPLGQLGLPGGSYRDEFNRMKPIRTAMYRQDEDMVLEATYISTEIPGIEYTAINGLNGKGVFTRRHKVANVSTETIGCKLKDQSNAGLEHKTVIPYNGGIHTISDGLNGEASDIETSLIDENWVFEDHTKCPNGLCWPVEYKPQVSWGNGFFFEHEVSLKPGETFETKPVVIIHGLFPDYTAFRDFARQTYTLIPAPVIPHIQWEINGNNPFASNETWHVRLHHHRSAKLDGEIKVTAGESVFTENESRGFSLTKPVLPDDGISVITTDMRLENLHKKDAKAIFTPRMEKVVSTDETDGVFTASNGVITFKAAPGFSDACFSCVKDGQEWFTSCYPSREPFAWYNPFVGGLNADLQDMREAITLREPITAAFTQETDTLGNVWKGISTTVTIEKFDKHKGVSYTQYYLTLPGLPVLCYFARLHNRSGLYKKINMEWGVYFGPPDDIKSLTLSGIDIQGTRYRFPAGYDSWWRDIDRLAVLEISGRNDKLYLYRDTSGANPFLMDVDTKTCAVYTSWPMDIEDGGVSVSKPAFVILSPRELTADMLKELDGVGFR
jgi:hypothetical protein